MGKQRYSCFQANGPELFSINHQSLQSSRETRPKRLPGTCVGPRTAWGARVHLSGPRPARAPGPGEGARRPGAPEVRIQIPLTLGTLALRRAHRVLLAAPWPRAVPLTRPHPAHNKGGFPKDARSSPPGSPEGTGRETAPGRTTRDPRARRAAPAGDKGAARGAGAQGGTPERSRRGLTFAAARLLSWSRRAAGSSSSQTPSRGPMVARPRRRGRRGTAAAAHSRRAGTRARRTVRGAAARGGDLSAAPRAPQFVGGSPSPGPPRRAAPQRGGPCGAGKRRRERAAGGLWPPRAGTQGSALRTQRRPSRRSRSPTQRSSEGGHAGPRPAPKAREGGRAAGPPATLVESGCARATAPEARPR